MTRTILTRTRTATAVRSALIMARTIASVRTGEGVIDPRTIPQFMAGAIFLPGIGVGSPDGDGNRYWTSQATAGDIIGTHGSFQPPTPSTADNGAACWKMNGANGMIGTLTAPASTRFASKGCYAGWFKAGANDTAIHTMLSMYGGGATDCRITLQTSVSGETGRITINGSDDGTGTAGDGSHRFKYNSGGSDGAVDYTTWHAFILKFDYDLDNYESGGANLSNKMRVLLDGVHRPGTGYSAPPAPFSTPPDGPVIGSGLSTNATRYTYGGDYVSSCWWSSTGVWQMGAQLVAVGDIPDWEILAALNFNRPA